MRKIPRVSIGVPVFNGENYLKRSIESILNQDFRELELIISDNASSDNTEEICRGYCLRDERVRYYRNEANVGASRNYNIVYELSRGEYFKWAAHDDECHPSMLRRCVEALDQAPDSVAMVYALGELIDEGGKTLESPLDRIASSDHRPHRRLSRLLWTLNMCDPIFGVYRASYLKRTQLIGPFCGADYVLLGELAIMGQITEIDEVLFRLRAHPKRSMQANASTRARAAWYDPNALRKAFVLPDWEQMVWEMLKSAGRAKLPLDEKLKCLMAIVATHYSRRAKDAGGLVKRRIKRAIGPAKAGSSALANGST